MVKRSCLTAVWLTIFWLAWAGSASSQERTPIPDFSGERLYVSGVEESFTAVQSEIDRLEARSPQTYYVVVVRSAGEGEWAARNYVDELQQTWLRQATEKELPLDQQRSIIIVLAMQNRQLAVHAGERLQKQHGLHGQAVDLEIVAPTFKPLALEGKYVEGLVALLDAFDARVSAKEKELSAQPHAVATAPKQPPSADVAVRGNPPAPSLPALVGVSLFGAAALAIALRWWFSRSRRLKTQRELGQFKDQVVALNDTLDALQRRHGLLPFSDTDFSTPMQGETLALYTAAEAAIGRHRQRWLQLMEARQQAEELLEQAGPFSTRLLNAARQAIAAAGAAQVTEAVQKDCAAPLDRLEQAHEEAQRLIEVAAEERQTLTKRIESVAAVKLATTPYQGPSRSVDDLIEQARPLLLADPIGAQTLLAQARDVVHGLDRQIESVLRLLKNAKEVQSRQTAAAELARRRRAEGFLLLEEGYNPDPSLLEAQETCQAAIEDLNGGLVDSAAARIERASQAVERATQGIERQVAARSRCAAEIPARRAETGRLRALLSASSASHTELERSFAAESWREVAPHRTESQKLLDQCEHRLGEALTAADERVQHYCRGSDLLQQVQELQKQAGGLLAAVEQRLQELKGIRQRCQARIAPLRELAERVSGFLRNNTADRPRANQRYQAARQLLDQLVVQAAQPRVDWPRTQSQLDEIQTGLEQALEWAQQDVRLADQAAGEISEAQRTILAARAWRSQGQSADVSAAEAQLARARSQWQAQAYEEAITQANAARQTARAAQESAERRAELQRLEQEEQRRRRESLAPQGLAAGAAAASFLMSAAGASSGSLTPPPLASGPPVAPEVPPAPSSPPAGAAAPVAGPSQPEATPGPASNPGSSSGSSQSSWPSSSSQTSW